MIYFLLIIGFVALIKGADFLVNGASALAKRLGISSLVIGLTVVAFGTSAPELIVNIFASINGNVDIAIGNIIGSNIANIMFILGLAAFVYPLAVKHSTVWKEIPLCFLAAIVLIIMSNDTFLENRPFSEISLIDGLILLSFFAIFLYYTFGISKVTPADAASLPAPKHNLLRSLLMIIGGLIGLTIGGKWVADGAVEIARAFDVSDALIGLTIVAVGTSLPELATSVVAALKKDVDIAVGNVVGSNILNIFFILGISALINPLRFSTQLFSDALIMLFATFLLFIFMFIGKKHTLERWQGAAFVGLYAAYIVYLVIRG